MRHMTEVSPREEFNCRRGSYTSLLVLFSPRRICQEYIVLLGKNGGSTVRVLEVGYRLWFDD